MPWRKWRSIKTKIMVAFIALLVLPIGLIAIFNYMKSASTLEDQAREQFLYLSEAANGQFNQYLTNLDTISMNIVESPVIQSRLKQRFVPLPEWTPTQIANETQVKKFLEGIHKLTPGLSGIAIYGNNGNIDFTHPSHTMNISFGLDQQPWYIKAGERSGSWVLSGKRVEAEYDLFLQPSTEEVVTFARLIKDLGTLKPLGMLVISIKLSALEAVLGIADTGRHYVMVNESGQTVLATTQAESRLDDPSWLQFSSVSPVTGWTSTHLVSRDELFQESKDMRNFIVLIAIALTAVAVIAAHFLSQGIVKPLQLLKSKMQEVEKGNFNLELSVDSMDEVGELTQRFIRMLSRMQDLQEENRLREGQKLQLELDALQARINPHFLYNTLMALRIQAVTDGNEKLGVLIASLVHLLKFSAKNKRKEVRLEHELELVGEYVKLLQLRNENFDYSIDIERGMEGHLVFPYLLQPIVENAVFHGIGPLHRRGTVSIALRTDGDDNVAMVTDDGIGMAEEERAKLLLPADHATESDGAHRMHKIGVRNVYERLKLQFGKRADMRIVSDLRQGTTVIVRWPIKRENESEVRES